MAKRTNTAKWVEAQNRWQINVQKDGIRRTFTSSAAGRTGQREANAKADAWLDDGIADQKIKVDKAFELYMQDIKARTSTSNIENADIVWRIWMKPTLKNVRVIDVTEQHLQDVINSAYQKGRAKKTIIGIRATMVSFIKFCRKKKLTTLVPESLIVPQGAPKKEKRILHPESIAILFQSDTTSWRGKPVRDDYINAYRLQVLIGLRPGELMGLMPNDIVGSVLHVSRSINKYGEITTGKNENAIRNIPLGERAKSVLAQQASVCKGIYLFNITNTNHYWHRWQVYCEYNNIPRISLYEMRHTFVSVAKQLSDGLIKPLVGHSRNMDTYGIYGHELKGEGSKTAADINSLFSDLINTTQTLENKA